MPQQDPSPAPGDPSHPAPILEYAAPDPPATLKLKRLLDEHPAIIVVVALIPLALGGYLLWDQLFPTGEIVYDFFCTTDEGKTVFVDHWPSTRKDAVIAVMYTCDNNKTRFCGYLLKSGPAPAEIAAHGVPRISYMKKPGDTEWIPVTNQRERAAIEASVRCPPGAGEPIPVTPYGMYRTVPGKADSSEKAAAK